MDSGITNNQVNSSEIIKFYKNKSVFVTGATGFLGKALIEKLLRACPDIDKIYILIREKRGKTAQQRLEDIYKNKLFDHVRSVNKDFSKKLIAVQGDLTEPNLGLSENDRSIMIENVNIVFHSAATVKFDEPLKVAVEMNIIGVKKIVDLCKQLKKIDAFVHVSTAYANCDQIHVSEEVYNPPVKPAKLIEAINWIEDDLMNLLTPKILRERPNTYTYTKALAESLIIDECQNIPCAIVRPSIVGATWREPFPGWVDNFNGPTALFPTIGTGVLRCMLGNPNATADLIPVDIPVNVMIASAWYSRAKANKKILVYNCTSGQINNVTWGALESYTIYSIFKNPFENVFIVPNPHFTLNRIVKYIRTLFEQLIPAYVMDFFLKMANKRPLMVKLQSKVEKAISVLEFFTTRQWEFTNDNIFLLMKEMNQYDKQMFNFDIKDLNWKNYFEQYCLGTKVYLMKEDLKNISACRKKMKRIKFVQYSLFFGAILLISKLILMNSSLIKRIYKIVFQIALGAIRLLKIKG